MKYKVLTSSSNIGIGFRTTICVNVRDFFGKESKKFLEKQEWNAQDLCGGFNQTDIKYNPVFLDVKRQGLLMFSATLQLEECESAKDVRVTYACSNIGTGFWTSICIAFASFFGKTSNHLMTKQYKMLDEAKKRLDEKLAKNYEDWEVIQTVQVLNKKLGVTLFALLVRDYKEEETIDILSREEQRRARRVKNKIKNIGEVDATSDSLERIKEAEQALDSLSDKEKAEIDNADLLKKAKSDFAHELYTGEEVVTKFKVIKDFEYHGYKFKEGMTGTVVKQASTTSVVNFDSKKIHGSFTVYNDCISTYEERIPKSTIAK